MQWVNGKRTVYLCPQQSDNGNAIQITDRNEILQASHQYLRCEVFIQSERIKNMVKKMRILKHKCISAVALCGLMLCHSQVTGTIRSVDNQNEHLPTENLHSSSTTTISSSNLKPFSAEYVAFRSGNDVGNAVLTLTSTQTNQYELTYKSKVSRFFLSDKRYEKTTFLNDQNNFVPITYEYKRTGTGPNKKLNLILIAKPVRL